MDGRNIREAERYARKNGWSTNPLVCPKCRGNLTKHEPDDGESPAETELSNDEMDSDYQLWSNM